MKITKTGASPARLEKNDAFSTSFRAPACTRLRTWSVSPPVLLFPECYSRKSPANMVLNVYIINFCEDLYSRAERATKVAAKLKQERFVAKKSRPFFSSLLQKCSLFETCKQQSTFL
jgi:hypothetical protein